MAIDDKELNKQSISDRFSELGRRVSIVHYGAVGINDVRDCKEYFNCRSTREFRAHIRRSTDLSRNGRGVASIQRDKEQRKRAGTTQREGDLGLGTVGWMHRVG